MSFIDRFNAEFRVIMTNLGADPERLCYAYAVMPDGLRSYVLCAAQRMATRA